MCNFEEIMHGLTAITDHRKCLDHWHILLTGADVGLSNRSRWDGGEIRRNPV